MSQPLWKHALVLSSLTVPATVIVAAMMQGPSVEAIAKLDGVHDVYKSRGFKHDRQTLCGMLLVSSDAFLSNDLGISNPVYFAELKDTCRRLY